MFRFYSYPPIEAGWGYILRNIKQKPHPFYRHEIVDIGIYDLLKSEDHRHSNNKLKDWHNLKTDGWKVVPDCPDLLGEFGQEVDFDNIDYSKELLIKYYDPSDVTQMPVIQGHFQDVQSVIDYVKWFKREYGEPDKIAVGSLCKNNYQNVAIDTLHYIKNEFPHTHIHGFGIRFKQLRKVWMYIDSSDTTAWTMQRYPKITKTANNKFERIDMFYTYVKKINEFVDNSQRRLI